MSRITPTTKVGLYNAKDQVVHIELIRLAVIAKKVNIELRLSKEGGPAVEWAMKFLDCPPDYPPEGLLYHLETSYESIMRQYEGELTLLLTDEEGNVYE